MQHSSDTSSKSTYYACNRCQGPVPGFTISVPNSWNVPWMVGSQFRLDYGPSNGIVRTMMRKAGFTEESWAITGFLVGNLCQTGSPRVRSSGILGLPPAECQTKSMEGQRMHGVKATQRAPIKIWPSAQCLIKPTALLEWSIELDMAPAEFWPVMQ